MVRGSLPLSEGQAAVARPAGTVAPEPLHVGKNQFVITDRLATLRPKISDKPAPPVEPERNPGRPPSELVTAPKPTPLDNAVNSSTGRCVTFTLTLLLFGLSNVGFIYWQDPQRRLSNEAGLVLAAAIFCALIMYTLVPALAGAAGMAPSANGVDWKPYLVCYRCAFLTAAPSFVLLGLGYSVERGFGEAQGLAGEVQISQLEKASLKYFEASDGFVALNLTKGVYETLQPMPHGTPEALRLSRFRNAMLRINPEPANDEPQPTEPPGILRLFRIAPVFRTWAACATEYAVLPTCLVENAIVGWALAKTNSLCTQLSMVACRPPQPTLDPVYQCSSASPVNGSLVKGSVSGLCGRVVQAPPKPVINELTAMLLSQGWPQVALPNITHVWLDVSPDKCIADPAGCSSTWQTLGSVGLCFAVVTVGCVLIPCVLDCIVDKRIREASRYFAESTKPNARVAI